jgi:type IV pilus assembly protein PilQ
MKRQAIVLLTVTWVVLVLVAPIGSRAWEGDLAVLQSVTLSTGPTGTELVLGVEGFYTYGISQSSPETLNIDLAGTKVGGVPPSQPWESPVFAGYHIVPLQNANGQPVVRVQVGTKRAESFVIQKDGSNLRLIFGESQPELATRSTASASMPPEHPAQPRLMALPDHPVQIYNVTFDKRETGETTLKVFTSRITRYRARVYANPARLEVDIDGAWTGSHDKDYTVDTPVLKGVRIGQFRGSDPGVVRLVAELNGNPTHEVHATSAGISIELHPRGDSDSPASMIPIPVVQDKPRAINPLAASPSAALRQLVTEVRPVKATEPVERQSRAASVLKAENHEIAKLDVESTLPPVANLSRSSAAQLPLIAKSTPAAVRAGQAAQTLASSKSDPPAAGQTVPAPPPPPAGGEEPKPQYTGETISLNLKDVDLKDFFRLIHEISGLNIVIDPNVTGSVTVVLDSVPWDQALDIVLKNNDLGKVLEGNVLRIARMQTLTAEQEGQVKLAAARMDAAPLVTVFRPVNYAKAADIATLLKTWAGGGALSRRGTVLVDNRANTLIISDVQSQIPTIQSILTKLDRKAKQVSIEARVVLANADFTRTLAASLLGGYGNNSTTTAAGTGANTTQTIPAPTTSSPIPIITTTPATSGGFGVASITNFSARYFINAAISAAEERDQAKTISRPTIVTQNNIQGMVQQGVQVPIQTTINNTVSVQYYAATLQLTVTPQVTDDGNIFLIIHVLNDSVGASISGVGPEINTQEATTQVLVPDGGTVVFGGITVTSRSKSATYVPWLGNIPVLGHLFKTSNVQDQDQELLFFVSPKMLPT